MFIKFVIKYVGRFIILLTLGIVLLFLRILAFGSFVITSFCSMIKMFASKGNKLYKEVLK